MEQEYGGEKERRGMNGVEKQAEDAAALPSCREWGTGERES